MSKPQFQAGVRYEATLQDVISWLTCEANPLRACWEPEDAQAGEVMARQIVAAGGITEPIVAYESGEIHNGGRRWQGAMALVMNPEKFGAEDPGDWPATIDIIDKIDTPAHEIQDRLTRNSGAMSPADFIAAYGAAAKAGIGAEEVAQRVGHAKDMQVTYSALRDLPQGLLRKLVKDQIRISDLRFFVTLAPELRKTMLEVADQEGVHVAMAKASQALADSAAADPQKTPEEKQEVKERAERVTRAAEKAQEAGLPPAKAAAAAQAAMQGREESPWTISQVRQKLAANAPECPISMVLFELFDGFYDEKTQNDVWKQIEILGAGEDKLKASSKIITYYNRAAARRKKASGDKIADIRVRKPKAETKAAAAKKAAAPKKTAAKAKPKPRAAKPKATPEAQASA